VEGPGVNAPFAELGAFGCVAAGLFGLVVGSFVNVLVHRLPRGESVVSPGSHCPACGAAILARDNIPVVSWLLLGGRCRVCRAAISPRYPVIELATGALWSLVFLRAREWPEFAGDAFFVSACVALAAIDAEFQILPDRITLPGIAAGILIAFVSKTRTPGGALLGAFAGGGGLFLVAFLYEKIAGHEGMGLGDVKMLAMIGAFLGPSGVLVSVLLASVTGSAVGLAAIAAGRGDRKMRLPFGVFLAAGGVAALFFADALLSRYRALFP
jgi:leader peptidase (prepilin peptidase) / N-methyltransferase